MTTRLYDPATTDPVVRGVLIVTMAVIVVGMPAPIRAAIAGRTHHVTVRVDNQTGVVVQVDALDTANARVGLGEAEPGTLRTFHEVPDIGAHRTFVAGYRGWEVSRETLARSELADRNWTITVLTDAADTFQQPGFQ